MDIKQYTMSYMTDIIESGHANGKTIIIDPDLFRSLNHTIPQHDGDIVFVGFDVNTPLELIGTSDMRLEVTGDIWVVDSILETICRDANIGGLKLIRSNVSPKYRLPFLNFPIYMDEESFEFYMEQRRSDHRKLYNNSAIVAWNDQKANVNLDEVLNNSDKIDLISYLQATHPKISLKDTEEGIQIEGNNIELSGPFLFDLRGISKIIGDVLIYNDFKQKFGDVKVEGQIAVINRY